MYIWWLVVVSSPLPVSVVEARLELSRMPTATRMISRPSSLKAPEVADQLEHAAEDPQNFRFLTIFEVFLEVQ